MMGAATGIIFGLSAIGESSLSKHAFQDRAVLRDEARVRELPLDAGARDRGHRAAGVVVLRQLEDLASVALEIEGVDRVAVPALDHGLLRSVLVPDEDGHAARRGLERGERHALAARLAP